jgi:TP53 regulating kinase-like protein
VNRKKIRWTTKKSLITKLGFQELTMSVSLSLSMSMSTNDNNNDSISNADAPPPPAYTPPPFTPQEDWTLISQGAEARLWKIPSFTHTGKDTTGNTSNQENKKRNSAGESIAASSAAAEESDVPTAPETVTVIAVAKERFTKSYRHPVLDERLTKSRCRAEARILEKCLVKGGMDVPAVYQVQAPVIYLEFIDGVTVRDYLLETVSVSGGPKVPAEDSMNTEDNVNNNNNNIENMAKSIGTTIGRLHSLGVVHGDLTTSNMMLRTSNTSSLNNNNNNNINITLIDFGLGKNTESAEERAVDLYVLERALLSTHPTLPETFWDVLMESYAVAAAVGTTAGTATNASSAKSQATLTRLEQVRQRGRKRECFG